MDAPWHPWVNKQPLNQADGVRRLHEPPQDGAGAQIKHSGSSDFTPRHFFFNPLEFHGCIYGNYLFICPLVLLYMQTPPWDLIICIPVATSEDTEVRSSAKLMVGGSWFVTWRWVYAIFVCFFTHWFSDLYTKAEWVWFSSDLPIFLTSGLVFKVIWRSNMVDFFCNRKKCDSSQWLLDTFCIPLSFCFS